MIRKLVLGCSLLTLSGCVSATNELSSVQTQELARRQTQEVALADPAATDQAANPADPALAAAPADPDQLYPVADPAAATEQPAAMPGQIAMQPGAIAATKTSIYANPALQAQTLNAQAAELGQPGLRPGDAMPGDPALVTADASAPSLVPIPSVSPLKSSLYSADLPAEAPVTTQTVPQLTAALDQPVEQPPVQEILPIDPNAESADQLLPGEEYPGQHASRLPIPSKLDDEAGDPGLTLSDGADSATEPLPSMAELEQPRAKKKFSLADLFRKQGKEPARRKRVDLAQVPNFNPSGSLDPLPGVKNANAMFPAPGMTDAAGDEDEDAPAGLMKLASAPTMMRLAPNGLWLQTDKVEIRCLRPELVSMLKRIEKHYNRPVIVTSGFRDKRHNRRAGGVRGSLHMLCAAADIQIEGVGKWELAEYLRTMPGRGGVGTYCHTDSVHVDVGDERDWNWRCRRKKRRH